MQYYMVFSFEIIVYLIPLYHEKLFQIKVNLLTTSNILLNEIDTEKNVDAEINNNKP